jgi:hypothetical protein
MISFSRQPARISSTTVGDRRRQLQAFRLHLPQHLADAA